MGGGGSSGGSGQTTYQTSQSSNAPPAYLQPFLQGGIQDLSNYYNAHTTAPSYYSGETVAPLSAQSQGAVSNATSLANNNPTLSSANTALQGFINGNYVNPNTNPDFQSALAASHQPFIDQFNNQILPGIQSSMEGAGRYGSGANPNLVNQATKTLGTTISNADAQAGSQYYTNALGQQANAAAVGAPNLNAANWQNVAGLGAAGTTVDQQRQAQDTSNQSAYNYNANSQMNYISQYLAMLNGGYPGGESTGSSTGQSYQPANSFSSMAGAGLGGLGLGLQAFNSFSDERLKDDIAVIGKTHDGQPIHIFKYKGDDKPTIGLMAQEVEKVRPEAVSMDPSGFKKVNYATALGLF